MPPRRTTNPAGFPNQIDVQATSGRGRRDPELVRTLVWNILSINSHMEDIRYFWAGVLHVSGPQWLIVMAVHDLDRGKGVSVREVSAKLHVDPSFVTTQTKQLEKNGFMRRKSSLEDARVVLLSLTDKAQKGLASLSTRQEGVEDYVFNDLSDQELERFTETLTMLRLRLEKASLRLAAEI
ncbi:MarR family transcriptional regulator [Bradyrhizobium sp. dw_78]|uniref:MarR family winged helix-turn-helix transcriptional regulator n=1 Tax=Bradyrhizobium sp. dw_78 TaxID=2719793 RepID=UPI001BD66B65|nr:MarR family transcriptional regulator [Bradyrhizobium sp. dw_78]